jgi:tetraacyldisaccharide 4'-kinase
MKSLDNILFVPFLNVISIAFKSISFINLKIKALGQKKYPGIAIISIDNLSFGGTGKTSLVIRLGELLQEAGVPFAVVSRGYRSQYEKSGLAVEIDHTAAEVGDEAKLLKLRFPDRDILIGRNRGESIKRAAANNNRVILLDDGLQSTDIYKDVGIMLFNPRSPYYYLRNFKFLMKTEDFILIYEPEQAVVNKCGCGTRGFYRFERENFYDRAGNTVDPKGYALFGFSALGDNLRFKRDLADFNLKGFKSYRDHYAFTGKDLRFLDELRKEAKADYLVCTEKDYVKIMDHYFKNIPLIYVKNVIKCNIDLFKVISKYAAKKKTDQNET